VSDTPYDVLIIGEGVAGLTAARTLGAAGLRVATFEEQLFGGLVINVNELDPAPARGVASGAEYAADLMQQSAEAGVESFPEPVTAVRAAGNLLEVATASETRTARAVVVASGAKLKRLGVPGELEFEGRGVSQCADCDGPMYQGETVVVVGGGDSALQEALVLTHYCGKVYLVHRRDQFRARADLIEQVKSNDRITTVYDATVSEVKGDDGVKAVTLRHKDGRTEDLACAGLFAYIGLEPNTQMLPADVARDAHGCVKTGADCESSLRNVWAIGAARSGYAGALTDAIADAGRAAAAVRLRLT
jgi:thioredoxin reductase (NADPH)